MSNKELITRMLWMLQRQKFADWYWYGQFNKYIIGDMAHEQNLTNDQCVKIIREDIANFLQIEDKD